MRRAVGVRALFSRGEGDLADFCMVIVLFKSMGEILLFQLLVMTVEPECCCGIAAPIMICVHYIFSEVQEMFLESQLAI